MDGNVYTLHAAKFAVWLQFRVIDFVGLLNKLFYF
jgi:hypothetical protein